MRVPFWRHIGAESRDAGLAQLSYLINRLYEEGNEPTLHALASPSFSEALEYFIDTEVEIAD